ncbi:STE like transcription factor-domain-containing protein, partial [Cunninghamella echinulata]
MESIEEIILPPPTEESLDTRLEQINQLKYFLTTAPKSFHDNDNEQDQEGSLKRYTLPTGETISCVHWQDDYFISGTDIVRSLVFRFYAFGRPVENMKKFEEGIFSDLRNLKPGNDATLEEPKSNFLNLLYKNNCIRTQKKQKVFRWFAVPHDRLFLDALERDLKREKLGIEVTSRALVHPAISITLDTTQA